MVRLLQFGCCLISLGAGASPAGRVRPFSAVVRTDYYSESGRLERSVLLHYFRYSDRSFVMQQQELLPDARDMVSQIVDVTGRRQIFLEPVTRSASTLAYGEDPLNGWDETCPTAEDDVRDSGPGGVFFGHESRRVRTVWSADSVEERWMLPEFGCFTVKKTESLIKATGAVGAHNVHRALEFTEGEPSRMLLSVPGEYVERSPGEMERLYLGATGRELWGGGLGLMEREYRGR